MHLDETNSLSGAQKAMILVTLHATRQEEQR
jgi:hypothetical protein